MSKKIQLDKVTLEFDERSGYIHLKSADKLLKGKPMKIKVTGNSPSYDSLLQLMETKSKEPLGKITLPPSRTLNDLGELLPKNGPCSDLIVGENPYGHEVWDLRNNPHSLIVGTAGSGISSLTHTLAVRAAIDPSVLLYAANPRKVDIPDNHIGTGDKSAKTRKEIETMMNELIGMIKSRYKIMEKSGSNTLDLLPAGRRPPFVFFVNANLEAMFELYGDDSKGLNEYFEKLGVILRMGRAAGIFCFQFSDGSSLRSMPNSVMMGYHRRVAFGTMSNELSKEVLGDYPNFSGTYLSIGRAVVRNYNEQSLMQSFYIPTELYPWNQ